MESDGIQTFLGKILSAATPQSSAAEHSNSVGDRFGTSKGCQERLSLYGHVCMGHYQRLCSCGKGLLSDLLDVHASLIEGLSII